jgi:hypothetical protein
MLAFSIPGLVTIPLIRVRMYSEFLLILLAAVGLLEIVHGLVRRPPLVTREFGPG